jgi:hypothetical protein
MAAYRDGALEADGLNIVDDLAVLALVASTRVQDGYAGNRDHFDPVGTNSGHQAASQIGMGLAMS